MIYLYLFGTCFHFIYVFMIIGKNGMKEDKELPHGRETEVSKLSVDFIQAQMTRIYSFKRL